MTTLENRIPPPLVLVAVALAMWGAMHAAGDTPFAGSKIPAIAGWLLILVGVGLIMSGFSEFRRANTTIDPVNLDRATRLVTSGIFSRTRNPMYLGFTVMLLGWTVILGSPWALAGPALFALFIQRFQINPEERVMSEKFGEAFDAYRKRVRRWI